MSQCIPASPRRQVASVGRPIILRMDAVQPSPVQWLWDNKIPRGKLTLWVGDPGVGKSAGSTDIAARVSADLGFPDGSPTRGPAGVVLISAEDGADDTIRPRLDVAGADVSRISLVQSVSWFDENLGTSERQLDLQRDLPALEEAIQQTADCVLVVVDPVTSYLGKIDSHKNAEVRAVLTPLAKMAAKYCVAILGITHLNKSTARAMDRVTGSLAFVAQARAVWIVGRDKKDHERRLVACLKNNLARDTMGMAYRLVDVGGYPRAEWEPDPVDIRADDLLAQERADATAREGRHREVETWLKKLLADGPMCSREVEAEAKGADIPWAAVRAAKARLGIVPYHEGGRHGSWKWTLPQSCEVLPVTEH
jgi:putative DNA primase/helicase